ncbi:hypothetical protein BDZ91DRAFT_745358 [Kalaharituber pfeilii]|nr:hypothetical protein BDZ91DRAFT_745358 [Kalaharituber pfeilii]
MQFIPTFTALFLAISSTVLASPTPVNSAKRACVTVFPTLQVPVDSSAPTRVYGSSSEVTLWNFSHGSRNMLLKFDIPAEATDCKLKFHAVANPPMSTSGPIDVSAYSLVSPIVSNTSWNGRPARAGLAGAANIAVSPTAPTEETIVTTACTSDSMNFELEVQTLGGRLAFTADTNNGFFMTYGC